MSLRLSIAVKSAGSCARPGREVPLGRVRRARHAWGSGRSRRTGRAGLSLRPGCAGRTRRANLVPADGRVSGLAPTKGHRPDRHVVERALLRGETCRVGIRWCGRDRADDGHEHEDCRHSEGKPEQTAPFPSACEDWRHGSTSDRRGGWSASKRDGTSRGPLALGPVPRETPCRPGPPRWHEDANRPPARQAKIPQYGDSGHTVEPDSLPDRTDL